MPIYPEPPAGKGLRRKVWEKRVWLESTFGFSMMELWEKVLVLGAFTLMLTLFWASIFTLYPPHFAYLSRRFSYYVFNDENVSAVEVIREWFRSQSDRILGEVSSAVGVGSSGKARVVIGGEL